MPQTGLSYVTIATPDLQMSRSFYRGVFGWEARAAAEGVAFIRLDRITLALVEQAMFENIVHNRVDTSSPSATLFSWNTASRGEVGELLGRAERHHGVILRPEGPMEWGAWAGVFRSPEGALWEVSWKPE